MTATERLAALRALMAEAGVRNIVSFNTRVERILNELEAEKSAKAGPSGRAIVLDEEDVAEVGRMFDDVLDLKGNGKVTSTEFCAAMIGFGETYRLLSGSGRGAGKRQTYTPSSSKPEQQ